MRSIWQIIILSIIGVTLASCASVPLETAYVPADVTGWDVGYAKDVRGQGNIVEYVKAPETINNWTKLITIQFLEGYKERPRTVMDRLESSMRGRCPDVQWSVINETETTVLYEWKIEGCHGQDDQHEISKLLKGNDGVHRAAYAEKEASIDTVIRQRWVDWLSKAYVEKAGERVVIK